MRLKKRHEYYVQKGLKLKYNQIVVRAVFFIVSALILFSFQCYSWGGATHRFINRESVKYLPQSVPLFVNNVQFLDDHASDADNRKSSDPNEDPKHFIDIDAYPEYFQGILPHALDSMILRFGSTKVYAEGILPWATAWAFDSLIATLARNDTMKALLFASDLGHYVADGHQPLHVTSNYNGASTGNTGIHSRYESSMMNTYLSTVRLTPRPGEFIDNVIEYTFSYLTIAQHNVDSIIRADNLAKAASSGSYNTAYYSRLWLETGTMTVREIDEASRDLASLLYTAAVRAGLVTHTSVAPVRSLAETFLVEQNYPNPFNSTTSIQFSLPEKSSVQLAVYSAIGEEVAVLAEGVYSAGVHRVQWNADALASGVYYYRVLAGNRSIVKPMILLK
jgi:hypothetical protein